MHEIKVDQIEVGYTGGLYKTIHIIVTAEERRDINVNIEENWSPFELEGLIIQVNTNPGAIGVPAGEFFEMEGTLKCSDCKNKNHWGRTIPCRKRSVIHMAVET